MEKIDASNINNNRDVNAENKPFSEHTLREWFKLSNDVLVFTHSFGQPPAVVQGIMLYCSGMVDSRMINELIIPELIQIYDRTSFRRKEEISRASQLQWAALDNSLDPINSSLLAAYLFEGHLLFCLPSVQAIWTIDIANLPSRQPEESSTEVSIRGPKDGFVEKLAMDVALIRKRLRTNTLACEYYVLGSRTMTKVALMYISDVANQDTINHIRNKISGIKVEQLLTTGQLEELITPGSVNLFPTTDYTGRPDFAADCLLSGRFIILVDGNPTAIIAPVNLFLLLKSPEDSYFPFLSSDMGRILRLIGLITTIFLPGFYISLTTFHADQVPFPLLATISVGRHGLPMESALEMFFIMSLMELFREAGVRLPSSIGQTLTVVGGLIIGDAAIRAGMVSPLMIVIIAITVVSGSTLVNQELTSTTILLRFISYICAATLGMYGFILSFILFVIYLSSVQSFGVPYMAPAAPLNIREFIKSMFKLPFGLRWKRPAVLQTQQPTRKGTEP